MNTLRGRGFLEIASIPLSKSKWQYSFMLLNILEILSDPENMEEMD
jgi:hypothetical protein